MTPSSHAAAMQSYMVIAIGAAYTVLAFPDGSRMTSDETQARALADLHMRDTGETTVVVVGLAFYQAD